MLWVSKVCRSQRHPCEEAPLSYDIEMLQLSGAGDLLARVHAARNAEIQREEAGEDPVTSAEKNERRAELTADLVALHPSLYSEPFDRGPSYGCFIRTDDPDCCIPDIDVGIDSAIVYFSYSADFERVLPELKRIIGVFERHGYTAYDRQTDNVVTSSSTFGQSASSFAETRDSVVREMQARGETVIGYPTRRKPFWAVATVVIFLVLAIVLIRQHYDSQTSPSARKELRDLQDRLKKP